LKKAHWGKRLWRHCGTCWLAIDVPVEPNREAPSEPCHLWLDPTDAKIGWPTLLPDSYDVCTQSKVTALQLRKFPALADTLTEGPGAAESAILHLSGSQAAQCFDNDSCHDPTRSSKCPWATRSLPAMPFRECMV
jgi:hypothetical protein